MVLAEEVEAHVGVGLLFGLFLLLLGGWGLFSGGATGSGGWGGSTTGWDGGEEAHALGADFVDVLAVELGEHLVELSVFDVGADRLEDLLNGGLGWRLAVKGGQHVSSDVLHLVGWFWWCLV